jgi:hypothetical protein
MSEKLPAADSDRPSGAARRETPDAPNAVVDNAITKKRLTPLDAGAPPATPLAAEPEIEPEEPQGFDPYNTAKTRVLWQTKRERR